MATTGGHRCDDDETLRGRKAPKLTLPMEEEMEVTRNYHRLESITYKLTEYDIRRACEQYLEKHHGVQRHEGRWTFEMWDEDDGKCVAELVQRFSKEIDPPIPPGDVI